MKTRLAGAALIVLGIVIAWLIVDGPLRSGATFISPSRAKGIVFVPFAVVIGLTLLIGGPSALGAFQARPKTIGQLTLVLSVIIVSGVLAGIGYWQLRARWLANQEQPEIIQDGDFTPQVPQVRQPEFPARPQD